MAGAAHPVAGVRCSVAGAIHSVAGVIHSVAGVVCPVAGAHYPVAGVMYTVLEIHFMAGVAGGFHCVAVVSPISSVISALLDCRLAGTVVDHSLMSGVMYSQAGIISHIAAYTQFMACVLTIHAIWRIQHYKCQWMWMYTGTGLHMKRL